MNKLIYLKLELKKNLKLIPYLLAGAIALSTLIGAVAFCAEKILSSSNKLNEKKTIAFSSEDDSKLTEIIVSSLSKSESITSLFNIIEADYNDVERMAENDEAVVSVVIPKNFMYGLMIGSNYPIQIYFSSSTSIFSTIITELSRAAQNSLKAAEAGIYTLYDYYDANNALKYAPDANTKLNISYLKKALLRENMFKPITLSATGSLDFKTYYIASGIMLITLLLGCVFILRSKNANEIIAIKLKQHGVGAAVQSLVHIFCIFCTLFLLYTGILLTAYFINIFAGSDISFHIPYMLINGLAVCLCSAGIISFINSLFRGRFSAILALFILTVASAFICGAFIPSVLLPDSFIPISRYLPTTYLLNITGMILKGELFVKGLLKLLSYFILFTVLTILFTSISLHRFKNVRKFGKNQSKGGR